MVRIHLPPAESQQTFGPFRVVAIHKRSESQIHRNRVREVRIRRSIQSFPTRGEISSFSQGLMETILTRDHLARISHTAADFRKLVKQ